MPHHESQQPIAAAEQRDTHASVFAVFLRRLLNASERVRAAAYVDAEGECIDYCTRVPPDEARLLGAQLVSLSATMPRFARVDASMAPGSFVLRGRAGTYFFHRVADGCALVIAAEPSSPFPALAIVREVIHALAHETVRPPLPSETLVPLTRVEARRRGLAERVPVRFEYARLRCSVVRVLGRWCELDRTSFPRMMWRVAASDGHEYTLVHVVTTDRWYKLDR